MSTHVIEVEHLRKVFPARRGRRERVAVVDLSFQVDEGSAIGIVGGSGAGKTTVVSLLMGFTRPTSGVVKINGVERPELLRRSEHKKWARDIQVVFQDPYSSLDPNQRLGRVLDEVLRYHFALDRTQRARRVAELFDAVGLSDSLAGSYPHALSGGQLQRVAIARALALRPRILLLDESVAALDVSIQAQILNLLNDLRKELGITYIVISHDLGVIRYTTDRVVVMREGALVEEGLTSSVLDSPSHEYTKAMVDATPDPNWHL
ncbi:MAG: ABC transporter ATP-binding protein [Microbacteriaceae bacterium]|nr:MAG: ABC transporter ATP-binding protein [Microbacteriaceae bacterium]